MAQPPRQTTPFNAIGNNKAQDHATMLNGDSSSYNKVGYINSIQQVQIFHQQVCAAAGGSSLGSDHHLQESGVSTVVTSEKPDLDTYIGEFVELGRLISLGYQNLHRTAKPYRPFFKEIRTKVTEQDLKLESLNRSLVHALQQRKSFLISGPRYEGMVPVFSMLSMLEETLKRIRGAVNQDMQQALSKCVIELQGQENLNTSETSEALRHIHDPFVEALERVDLQLEDFEGLAKPFTELEMGRKHHGPNTSEHFQKLSVEGQTSDRIYNCLGQCCPRNHQHTTIIKLESRLYDENGHSAIAAQSKHTEYHMAIESTSGQTTGLIWLKVVPIVILEQPAVPPTPSRLATPKETNEQTRASEDSLPRLSKRPRSRSLEQPFKAPDPKAPKLCDGQSMAPNASNSSSKASSGSHDIGQVMVCPACLAPHNDNGDLPVMQIAHDSTFELQIYYLPMGDCPPVGFNRMNLSDVLRAFDDRQKKTPGSTRKKWTAQTARVIAESVLRFDWRHARQGPHMENLVFFHQNSTENFEPRGPFLEIKISNQRRPSETSTGTYSEALMAKEVVLNLGHILLELGSPKRPKFSAQGWDHKHYSNFLHDESRGGVATTKGMGRDYADVIQKCAFFEVSTLDGDKTLVKEAQFCQDFFEVIIAPLKRLEQNSR